MTPENKTNFTGFCSFMFITCVGLCFVLFVWAYTKERCKPQQIKEIERPMSVIESQLLLIELGFGDTIKGKVKADNKQGPIFEQAMCDYYCVQDFKRIER
jgi:hypothetical protein